MSERLKRARREQTSTPTHEATVDEHTTAVDDTEERHKTCNITPSHANPRGRVAEPSLVDTTRSTIADSSLARSARPTTLPGVSATSSITPTPITSTATLSTMSAANNNNNNSGDSSSSRPPAPQPERSRTLDSELDDLDLDEEFKESIRAMTPNTRREVLNDVIRERRLSMASSLLPPHVMEERQVAMSPAGLIFGGFPGSYSLSLTPNTLHRLFQSQQDGMDVRARHTRNSAPHNNNNDSEDDNEEDEEEDMHESEDGVGEDASVQTRTGNRCRNESARTAGVDATCPPRGRATAGNNEAVVHEHEVSTILDEDEDDDEDAMHDVLVQQSRETHTPVTQRIPSGRGSGRRRGRGGVGERAAAADEGAAIRTERQFVHDLELLTSLLLNMRQGNAELLPGIGSLNRNRSNAQGRNVVSGTPNNSYESSSNNSNSSSHNNSTEHATIHVHDEVDQNDDTEEESRERGLWPHRSGERGHETSPHDNHAAEGADEEERLPSTAAGGRGVRHGCRGRGGSARRDRRSAPSPSHIPFLGTSSARPARNSNNNNNNANNSSNNSHHPRHAATGDRRGVMAMLTMQEVINREFNNILSRLQERSVFQSMGITRDIDDMSYEELLELEERIGNVSKGLTQAQGHAAVEVLMCDPEEGCCSICQEEWSSPESAEMPHSPPTPATGQGETGVSVIAVPGDEAVHAVEDSHTGVSEVSAAAARTPSSPVSRRRCVKINVCGHNFHESCIDEWFKHNKTCPVCTRDVLEQ